MLSSKEINCTTENIWIDISVHCIIATSCHILSSNPKASYIIIPDKKITLYYCWFAESKSDNLSQFIQTKFNLTRKIKPIKKIRIKLR